MAVAEERDGVQALPEGVWRDRVTALLVTLLFALPGWPQSFNPNGDDAAYAESARAFAATGHIVYRGWASMVEVWQIVWGALFVKLFGPSAASLGVSTLLIGLLAVYLWHGVLLRFGISRKGALLGTLALGCSPLYLPVLLTYMTDPDGLLAIVLCISMCQRAVMAKTDRSTALWLAAAGVGNVAVGSVRQICWLGVLVMVPSTGWYLRRRRGALATSLVTLVVGAAGILGIMHWFGRQPYTQVEKVIPVPIVPQFFAHLAMQWVMALLLLVVVIGPVTAAWVVNTRPLSRAAWWRTGAVAALAAAGIFALRHRPEALGKAVFPWLEPVYVGLGMPRTVPGLSVPPLLGLRGRAVLSVLIVAAGWLLVEHGLRLVRDRRERAETRESGAILWILGPYTLLYCVAISSRGMFQQIQDRYLLLLTPPLLAWGLWLYERRMAKSVPAASWVVLLGLALYGTCGYHTDVAGSAAIDRLAARMQASGISREEIAEGFGKDIAAQVANGGHVNTFTIAYPADAYNPNTKPWDLAKRCTTGYGYLVPRIQPKYYLGETAGPTCFVPADVAPEPFIGWLPPFHRTVSAWRVADGAHADQ